MKRKKKVLIVFMVTGAILLLPFLLTIILSGRGVLEARKQWNMESVIPLLLCEEIPWEYEEETKKVQAVLTRSSLYLRIKNNEVSRKEWEELWRKVKTEQKKSGYRDAWKSMEKAVLETEGEMLFFQKNVCAGAFHRISSGMTRDGMEVLQTAGKGYLLSVDSKWDMYGEGYLSGHYFSGEALKTQLQKECPGMIFTEEPIEKQIVIEKRDGAGYVLEVSVGQKVFQGEEFRQILELPSSNFTIQETEETIRFLCKGQGHGLGFSQYGGNVLAREGKSYKEILRYYFPDCEAKKNSE